MLPVGSQPPPEAMPPEAMPPDIQPMPPEEDDSPDLHKVDPMIAGYKTPDLGPFMCGNCYHFDGQAGCEIVAGPIDPEGVCNIWSPPDHKQGGLNDESQMLAEAPEEVEEPEMASEEMA